MLIVAYYLSKCGERVDGRGSDPPRILGAKTWKDAYDLFFDVMSDGRSIKQFRNTLNGARSVFDFLFVDTEFDTGRRGWAHRQDGQPVPMPAFDKIREDLKNWSDQELEVYVLGLRAGTSLAEVEQIEARTEGGEKVYISTRRERDRGLRDAAIKLHGLDCMACGFNFEKFYGETGKDFIEVHHVVPLAAAGRTETNPVTDLIVLCANCHRITHSRRHICLSLDELKMHICSLRSR